MNSYAEPGGSLDAENVCSAYAEVLGGASDLGRSPGRFATFGKFIYFEKKPCTYGKKDDRAQLMKKLIEI